MHGTVPVAKTYKTPKELGFTQEEFDALAWFVDEFDAGRIPDAKIEKINRLSWYLVEPTIPPEAFYMRYAKVKHDCGTSGCIFGWVAHRAPDHHVMSSWPKPIQNLMLERSEDIKAVHARDATVRVLQGKPAWGGSTCRS